MNEICCIEEVHPLQAAAEQELGAPDSLPRLLDSPLTGGDHPDGAVQIDTLVQFDFAGCRGYLGHFARSHVSDGNDCLA